MSLRFLDWRIRNRTPVSLKLQGKSFWFPSCNSKSNTSMLYLSLEELIYVLFSLPVFALELFICCFETDWELGSEDYNVMYIPSASLCSVARLCGGQRMASSSMQGAEDGWETKPRYDIFDQNTTSEVSTLVPGGSVLHALSSFLGKS